MAASASNSTPIQRLRDVRVSLRHFRLLCLLTLVSLVALIGSGGWVRLSESGLGCPTWPRCYSHRLLAHDSYHALIEFANRCVITTVGVLVVLTLIAALIREQRRRDLIWLSAGLVVGYIGEAVLGGITVLFKLAPELVAAHLVLAMLLLVDGVVLHWRAGEVEPATATGAPSQVEPAAAAGAPSQVEPSALGSASQQAQPGAGLPVRQLGRLLLAAIAAVIVLGTVATGSGPRAGSPDTERFPFRFSSTVELHAVVGMFLFGLVVACWFLLRTSGAPLRIRKTYLVLLGAIALQGAIGYVQYFTKLQIDLVEIHIVGAALLLIVLLRFNLELGPPRITEADRAQVQRSTRRLTAPAAIKHGSQARSSV